MRRCRDLRIHIIGFVKSAGPFRDFQIWSDFYSIGIRLSEMSELFGIGFWLCFRICVFMDFPPAWALRPPMPDHVINLYDYVNFHISCSDRFLVQRTCTLQVSSKRNRAISIRRDFGPGRVRYTLLHTDCLLHM